MLGKLGCPSQERARGDQDSSVIGYLLNCRQQRSYRLWRTPSTYCNVGDLVAGEVEGCERGLGVDQKEPRRLIMIVLGIEGGEQDAGVEEQRRHGPGRVAFTWAAEPPP